MFIRSTVNRIRLFLKNVAPAQAGAQLIENTGLRHAPAISSINSNEASIAILSKIRPTSILCVLIIALVAMLGCGEVLR